MKEFIRFLTAPKTACAFAAFSAPVVAYCFFALPVIAEHVPWVAPIGTVVVLMAGSAIAGMVYTILGQGGDRARISRRAGSSVFWAPPRNTSITIGVRFEHGPFDPFSLWPT